MQKVVFFAAKFRKLPTTVEAVRQNEAFTVPKPRSWGDKGVLQGYTGDYLVRNITTGERYPVEPVVLAQKYQYVGGDLFRTLDQVIVEGRLPEPFEEVIQTRQGMAKTHVNGIPSVILEDESTQYPVTAQNMLLLYEPVDRKARRIFRFLKRLLLEQEDEMELL
ncbi:MAG: hypothetical protein AB7P76_03470 [Candidatus Melainabacteria bacterium]